MLFGRLQPPVATSTFDPTSCCLADYSLQWLPRSSTQQHAVLQPPVATSTFDPTSCCLTDYSIQWLHRPSTRHHAVCQTTASSGYLDLRPDNMLFDRLQPPVATSTFDPTTCCLTDYSLQWLPRPSTRQHAIWWTTASSGYLDLRLDMLFYSLQWLHRPSTRQHAV